MLLAPQGNRFREMVYPKILHPRSYFIRKRTKHPEAPLLQIQPNKSYILLSAFIMPPSPPTGRNKLVPPHLPSPTQVKLRYSPIMLTRVHKSRIPPPVVTMLLIPPTGCNKVVPPHPPPLIQVKRKLRCPPITITPLTKDRHFEQGLQNHLRTLVPKPTLFYKVLKQFNLLSHNFPQISKIW